MRPTSGAAEAEADDIFDAIDASVQQGEGAGGAEGEGGDVLDAIDSTVQALAP